MTDTDQMVTWLRAAMDTAERIALAAREGGEGRWHHLGDQHGGSVAGDHEGYHVACDEGYPTLEQATHIALHDPAAVLRRIEADRKILDEHEPTPADFDGIRRCLACGGYTIRPGWGDVGHRKVWPCPTVRLLAEGYGWTEEEQR